MALDSRAAKTLNICFTWYTLGFLALAVCLAVLLAMTPLHWGILGLTGTVVLVAVLWEPLVALVLVLLFSPARALLAAVGPTFPMYPGQVLLGVFLAAWLLHGLLRRRLRLHLPPFSVPMLLYVGVGAVSLWGAADPMSGITELIKWMQMFVVALLVSDCCRRRQVGWVLTAALVSGVMQAVIGLWQFGLRGSGPEAFQLAQGFYRAYGTFEQPNPFGGFMGMIWPLAAGVSVELFLALRRERGKALPILLPMLALGATVLTLGGLVVSYSRGAWIGALVATGIMAVLWPVRRVWRIMTAAVGLVLVVGVARVGALPVEIVPRFTSVMDLVRVQDVRGVTIDAVNFSLIERIAHWQAASRMATARPWLGVGLGNFQAAYPDYRLLNWEHALGHAHNVYLNVVAETGFLGLGAYMFLWASVFLVTLRAIEGSIGWQRGVSMGLLGVWTHLAVHNLADHLFVNNMHLYLGALLGVLDVIATRNSTYSMHYGDMAASHSSG